MATTRTCARLVVPWRRTRERMVATAAEAIVAARATFVMERPTAREVMPIMTTGMARTAGETGTARTTTTTVLARARHLVDDALVRGLHARDDRVARLVVELRLRVALANTRSVKTREQRAHAVCVAARRTTLDALVHLRAARHVRASIFIVAVPASHAALSVIAKALTGVVRRCFRLLLAGRELGVAGRELGRVARSGSHARVFVVRARCDARR
jgi:hypothetical protein